MNKIINVAVAALIVSFPVLGFAEYCKSSYSGKEFYEAYISDKDGASCEYRYCYYGCITESYNLPGHYAPSTASASRWEKVDGGYICSTGSSSCEFAAR